MKYNAPYGASDQNAPYINGNPATGTSGSIPPAQSIEHPQREIVQVIEDAGLIPRDNDLRQLSQAVNKIAENTVTSYDVPLAQLNALPWLPIISMGLTTPPSGPKVGDMYLIANGASGTWASKEGQIAEWTGETWLFSQPKDGHGISLPDGQIWLKIKGIYTSLDARYSRLTTPPTDTYYVIGDKGDDKNSGVAPNSNDGFATIQGAINAIQNRYMSTNIITINVAPGVYEGFSIKASMINKWAIIGDPGHPDKVIIDAIKSTSKNLRCCDVYSDELLLSGFSFQSYYENVIAAGGTISVWDCNVKLPGAGSAALASFGGKLSLHGNIAITGSGTSCIFAGEGGSTRLGYKDLTSFMPVYINYDNVSSNTNLDVQSSGTIILQAGATNFSGSCNGARYYAAANGVILLNGLGQYAIPGTRNGTTTSGGQLY